jgi:hypothetical protein
LAEEGLALLEQAWNAAAEFLESPAVPAEIEQMADKLVEKGRLSGDYIAGRCQGFGLVFSPAGAAID